VQDEVGHDVVLQYLLQRLFTGGGEEIESKSRRKALECPIAGCEEGDDWAITLGLRGTLVAPLKSVVQSDFLKG